HLVETGVDDETFVNFLAQNLDLDQLEKQALLEAATLDARARRLVDVLEFRLEELRLDPGGRQARRHHQAAARGRCGSGGRGGPRSRRPGSPAPAVSAA